MLKNLNPELIKPGLITIAVALALVIFWPVGAKDSKQANVTEKKTQQASSAKSNKKPAYKTSTSSKPVKKTKTQTTSTTKSSSTTSSKRRVVTSSRPGMKYRVVRYADEPEITPERELRKSSDKEQTTKEKGLAQN